MEKGVAFIHHLVVKQTLIFTQITEVDSVICGARHL